MSGSNFGIAIFEGGDPQGSGIHYACQAGHSPFSFSSVSELSSQVLWVTNARLDTLIEYGLNRNPKIAHEGYFRTRLAQVIQELGLGDLEPPRLASMLANIMSNAAVLVRKQLGMLQFPTNGIVQAVGQLYGTAEAHETTDLYRVAERSSQRFTSAERSRRMQNAEVFSFWEPRYEYAQRMLTRKLPTEGLQQVPPTSLPNGGMDAFEVSEWAQQLNLPVFAQIQIHSLDEGVGRLINHGAGAAELGGNYQARNFREWCALPELAYLAQSGEVEVKRVLAAPGWHDHGLRVLDTPSAQVSYSYGIVSENLWCGLMRQPSGFGRISKTLATAWLQACDRMEMLRKAEKLSALGFEIINFGSGRITVACPPSIYQLVPQAAMENGLLYPASLENLTMYPVSPGNRMHIQQKLISGREFAQMLRVDSMLLKEV